MKTVTKGSSEKIPWPSSHLDSCPKWKELSPTDRAAKVEEFKACCKCTNWKHESRHCWKQGLICKEMDGDHRCRKPHHSLLHGSGNAYCQANTLVKCIDDRLGQKALVLLAITGDVV